MCSCGFWIRSCVLYLYVDRIKHSFTFLNELCNETPVIWVEARVVEEDTQVSKASQPTNPDVFNVAEKETVRFSCPRSQSKEERKLLPDPLWFPVDPPHNTECCHLVASAPSLLWCIPGWGKSRLQLLVWKRIQ